jgi:hypothetical protein
VSPEPVRPGERIHDSDTGALAAISVAGVPEAETEVTEIGVYDVRASGGPSPLTPG